LSQGICSISLSQAGDSTYLAATSVATIASAPKLYASGYVSNGPDYYTTPGDTYSKLSTKSSTLEGGTVTSAAGGGWDEHNPDWNGKQNCWDTHWCNSKVASDGSTLSWSYTQQQNDKTHQRGVWTPQPWWGAWDIGATFWDHFGVEMYIGAPSAGVQVTTETSLGINLATNTEWYQGNHQISVRLKLAQIAGESCNIVLNADVRPVAAASNVWISLSNWSSTLPYFGISDSCGQNGLTVQSVLQSHPIAEVSLRTTREYSNNNSNGTNITIPSPAADWPTGPAYQTKYIVGAITLQ
jgi:hypothetical protein